MADKPSEIVDAFNQSIEDAQKSLDGLLSTSLTGGKAFESLASSVKQFGGAISEANQVLVGLIKSLPLGNTLAIPFELLSKVINGLGGVSGEALELITDIINGIDSFSANTRTLAKDVYSLGAGFGLTFEETQKFSKEFLKTSQLFTTSDFGYVSMNEALEAAKALGQASIPFKYLTSVVRTAVGEMDLYSASVLHAKSLGLDAGKYAGLLSNAIIKQGLNAEQAMEQLSGFGSTSKVTGLALSDVADSLQGLSNNFNKLGLSAEFGRPLLEGFTKTLSGMGLGIENAVGLSTDLGSALAKLTTNYSSAYLTFQRGGLDLGMGGGGALGAGIALQAKLLETEKAGGDQGELAKEITGAMKDTVASFTGGRIVTVQEAAQDPRLQATFYTQTELLKSLYDIQPENTARTLDYLSQIDDAVSEGNEDLAKKLSQDLQESIKSQDGTLSALEKLNVETEGQKARLLSINESIIRAYQLTGTAIVKALVAPQRALIDEMSGSMTGMNLTVDANLEDYQTQLDGLLGSIEDVVQNPTDAMKSLSDKLSADVGGAMKFGRDTVQKVADQAVLDAVQLLSGSIDKLTSVLDLILQQPKNGKLPGAAG